ncbi:Putative small nuclear ribonucleoprotein Prp3 [Colletotrichum destructivum]|uniref:Small nuclear ribonucleoprotein Prp3 n=1 Tax=Colletotrichum destructivum TaxID=34406 RepID=A0AAX4J0G6_9PEZI|nr:Putative small nuclear ribonucleoprotein Prp3 [Colletotrichum destructivum]
MATSSPSWHLLPPDLVEHQIGQIDLLMAMYPAEEEATIEKESEKILALLKSHLEDPSSSSSSPSPLTSTRPPQVSVLLTLTIAEQEEQGGKDPPATKTLQLDIAVPFSHPPGPAPDEAPRVAVRIRQPAWLSRAATAQLNARVPEDEDLFSTIEVVRDAAAEHLERAKLAEAEALAAGDNRLDADDDEDGDSGEPPHLVRVWFYFPSISTRSKRDDFIIHAPAYGLTGFLYAGKPGLLCLEGASRRVDAYMRFIKTESWGDIPAHHKKVSERHRETGVASRVFGDMSEITDSVGERRGQRANRGDMKAVEGWLVERGLGDAFAKVLM